MRFRRRPRLAYTVIERKCAAAHRSQQRQRDALPLLAQLATEQQPSVERLIHEGVADYNTTKQNRRDQRAQNGRRARRDLANFESAIRSALLQNWNEHRWLPGDPHYLPDMLHGVKTSRLTLSRTKLEPTRATINRHDATQNPLTRWPITSGWLGRRR